MFAVLLGLAFSLAQLTGTVFDPQGDPVPNATVVVTGLTIAPQSVRTDAEGHFEITGLAEGRFDLTASAPGLIGEARGISVTGSDPQTVHLTLRVSAVSEDLIVSTSHIDQPLSRVADTVTIIDGSEIDARQLSFVAEALSSVPGMAIARNGGPGTLTSLFPRGGESDFTLVLVDGIRTNVFGGGIDLSQVPLGDVERIEVVRGPQSAVYGSDAIGGVVQIITRRGGRPGFNARLEGGSRDTRRFGGATSGEANRWRWQAGGDYFADNGFTGLASNGEQVSNDDAQERQGWGGGGYRWTNGADAQGVFRYVDTNRGSPGPYGSDPAHTFSGVDRVSRGLTRRVSGGVRMVHPWGGSASRIRQRTEFDDADYDLTFISGFGTSDSATRRSHARAQLDAVLNAGASLSGGIEWLGERASNTFITSAGSPVPVQRHVIGTFGEVRWNGNEHFTLQAGVRAEHITRDELAVSGGVTAPDDTVVSVNPKIAGAWLVGGRSPAEGGRAWTRVRASVGTGIRPPDAFEIAFTDNPSLKPERSRSIEAGITQALAGGIVSLDLVAFYNRYDDLIVSVGRLSDVSRYRTDNVSNARARGLEASVAARAGIQTQLRASYTFLDAEILEIDGTSQAPSPYHVGDRLLRRPRHQGAIDVTWSSDRVTMFGSLIARGETLDAEPSFGPSGGLFENPGRAVLDMGGSYRVMRGIEVYARVLNLFDEDYEEVMGYPAPGRTAFAGIRLAARR